STHFPTRRSSDLGMSQVLAGERHSGNPTAKQDMAAEQLPVFLGITGFGVSDFEPVCFDAPVNKVAGTAKCSNQCPVHILTAVMFGPVGLPGKDCLVRCLLKTEGNGFVNQSVQAHILNDRLAQGVAVEEDMSHQSHTLRVNHLAGMQTNSRVSGQL